MTDSYKDRALEILKALLDDPTSEHGRALRVIVLELMQKRGRHRARILEGLARARARGTRLGRPAIYVRADPTVTGTVRELARQWGVSKSTAHRRLRQAA